MTTKRPMRNKTTLLFMWGMVVVLSLALLGLGTEGLLGLGKWKEDEPTGVVRWMVWPIVKAKVESDSEKWWNEADFQKWCREHFPEHECRRSRSSGVSYAEVMYMVEHPMEGVKSPKEHFQTGIGKTISLILSLAFIGLGGGLATVSIYRLFTVIRSSR